MGRDIVDRSTEERVFRQVSRCLDVLVGGSGHLASYSARPGTFHIERVELLPRQRMRYHFRVQASRVSEFTVFSEDNPPGVDELCGSIVLDADFGLVRGADGRVLLEPWTCLDPDAPDGGLAKAAGPEKPAGGGDREAPAT
jgi:hypothetical protein